MSITDLLVAAALLHFPASLAVFTSGLAAKSSTQPLSANAAPFVALPDTVASVGNDAAAASTSAS